MKLNIYSVFDSKAAHYGSPFFVANDGLALRSFGDLVNDPRSTVFAHCEDFTLHRIGSFEDGTAHLTPVNPIAVATAASLKKSVVDPNQLAMFEAQKNGTEKVLVKK